MCAQSYLSRLLVFACVVSAEGCLMTAQAVPAVSPTPVSTPGDAAVPIVTSVPTDLAGETLIPTVTSTPSPSLTATVKVSERVNAEPSAAAAAAVSGATPIPAVQAAAIPSTNTFTPGPTPTPCASWVIQPPIPSARDDGIRFCVQPAIRTFAAAQYFEGGAMIWLKNPGIYLLLTRKGDVYNVLDPLTIYRDTSAQFTPPAGLYAPVSGFGYVWRGDYLEDDALYAPDLARYRSDLGWATAPEFSYQTTYQCGSYACTGCRTNFCTLSYPDGRSILLDLPFGFTWPFGIWELVE